MTESVIAQPPGVARKKFAVPPVKNACLSCRASRTRCDGGKPCATCQSRFRECVYKPSRRGGPRGRRKPRPSEELPREGEAISSEIAPAVLDDVPDAPLEPISIENYIDPGAGLKQLEDWFQDSDFIFDSLFMSAPDGISGDASLEMPSTIPVQPIPMVRTYKSDDAILDAYYIFIHPFFPILPPPSSIPFDQAVPHLQNHVEDFEDGFEPSSPISLAISAILALIPCANDVDHLSHESIVFRRKYSQYLAQSAIESIEIENEIPDSSVEPPRALSESPVDPPRQPFHPLVPLELESIITLDLLSVYEYAQRGNLKKMQNRAGQALVSAMALSIHACSDEDDVFYEAKRRVWWMTYICVCQGSIVSNNKPTFAMFTPSFTTKYPVLQSDSEAFALYIQAQQAILSATQFVIELNAAVQANADMTHIYDRMRELELFLGPICDRSDSWILSSTTGSPVECSEDVVARSLRAMARIKLNSARIKVHRYCAFFDLPVFSGKHCDLKSTKAENAENTQEPRKWPACSCSTFNLPGASSGITPTSTSNGSTDSPSSNGDMHMTMPTPAVNFPFSSHHSAKICLKAALNIAQAFDNLPYPNPSGQLCQPPVTLSPNSSIIAPRTMPSFACCAMQCAYSLLMIHHKTKSIYPESAAGSPLVGSLLVRLQQGLTSIFATLENYATAFEALGGMRDQIRSAIESSMVFMV